MISVPTPPAPYDPAHVREGYSEEELSNLLIENGFKILKYSYCFYAILRLFYSFWQFQIVTLGNKNYIPRFLVRLVGYTDKYVKIGSPWDLVVLAQKLKSV